MDTPFEELIKQLGEQFGLPLELDSIGACSIEVDDSFPVQLEIDEVQQKVVAAAFIVEVPPGKFRENVFTQALKHNHHSKLKYGSFAFSTKMNQLILFIALPISGLTALFLAETVAQIIEKGRLWKEAIEAGLTHPAGETPDSPSSGPTPFGIRP